MPDAKTQRGQLEQELRRYQIIIYLLMGLIGLLGVAYWRIPTLLSVHVPPDMTQPHVLKPNEIWPISVYAFAEDLLVKLNYCREDCGRDYMRNLDQYRDFLTPRCREDLALHRQRNASLYESRAQQLLPTGDEVFDPAKVHRIGRDVWEVHLEFHVEHHVKGVQIGNRRIHYPMRIVYAPGIPLDKNPFQLAFDCYVAPGPQPVDVKPAT